MAQVVKYPSVKAGDLRDVGLIPGLGRSPGRGHSNPLQCSCLEIFMDRGTWSATVRWVTRVGHDWSNAACMHVIWAWLFGLSRWLRG